ncbi:type III toxin-antitoxin system ToxN/AbiQ family toxin [Fusobacterium sp. PH5-44]|uniref:type III toxin-antitoxin system ToxN/AbiQ family toxin n=1 Tax=unclassified Fusobacterium TaxID=2648384 RepID=UPI003D1CF94A
MKKIGFYEIDPNYLNYLRQFDNRILKPSDDGTNKTRKYIGILLSVEGKNYLAPLASPKKSDYLPDGTIRKSVIPIIRIVSKNDNGELELKGKIKLSSMIPVIDMSLVREYKIDLEKDKNYRHVIEKEMEFISNNKKLILNHARVLYNQKTKNFDIKYIENVVDFKLLETKAFEYKKK